MKRDLKRTKKQEPEGGSEIAGKKTKEKEIEAPNGREGYEMA